MTDIRHSYGHRAVLDGVGFSGRLGVMGIGGANGSGKSTLLDIAAGRIRPTSGSVSWTSSEGDVVPAASIRTRAGYCAPTLGLYPELTVRENLDLVCRLRGADARAVDEWMDRFQVGHVARQPVGHCSTGQQQRTRLATAFLHRPSLVFLDEPGSNLDAAGLAVLSELIGCGAYAVVLASNDPAELAWCGETVTVGSRQ
jgi:ABC-type multidrug transport system ATPase subunit